jgi:hypothetical protein
MAWELLVEAGSLTSLARWEETSIDRNEHRAVPDHGDECGQLVFGWKWSQREAPTRAVGEPRFSRIGSDSLPFPTFPSGVPPPSPVRFAAGQEEADAAVVLATTLGGR